MARQHNRRYPEQDRDWPRDRDQGHRERDQGYRGQGRHADRDDAYRGQGDDRGYGDAGRGGGPDLGPSREYELRGRGGGFAGGPRYYYDAEYATDRSRADRDTDPYGAHGTGAGTGRSHAGRDTFRGGDERGFLDRAGDEVASWFGDEDAERRRRMDHRGRGPEGYRRSDSRIAEDVNDGLTDDPYLDATAISVTVSDQEVTLDGEVDSRHAKRRAEDLADHVSGVQHVQNNLRVRRADVTGTATTRTT